MTYYLYHIPGKKIGVTRNLEERVHKQQGYSEGEYVILGESKDITVISNLEVQMQRAFGYKVDRQLYKNLNFNKEETNMKINVTEATTTFPCPVNKLKGQLMDNVGMTWETEHGQLTITPITVKWIMNNIKSSMYNDQRSYVYNKAFARFYDNNDAYDQYGGKTLAGGMSEHNTKKKQEYQEHNPEDYDMPTECCDEQNPCVCEPEFARRPRQTVGLNDFDLIRMWANQRGIYEHGDTKTQSLKLVEEVGEICRAILKEDHDEVVDGIGDAVVVLTNLAELQGVQIEHCIKEAYKVICQRSGKMVNGTFKKD